jgi:hypothetical protein
MKRIIGLCGVVMLALLVPVAAPAQAALPELGRCVKAADNKGAYRSAFCITPTPPGGKGKYNWLPGPGAKKKFSGTGEPTVLEAANKRKIECGGSTFEGEYTGPKTETVTVLLIGCTDVATKRPCQSGGPPREGEIESTAALAGELGFIKGGEKPVVGLDLKHEPALFAFECGVPPEQTTAVVIDGSVIAAVVASSTSNVNKMSEESILRYKTKSGKQVPENFEGGAKDTMTATFVTGLEKQVEAIGLLSTVTDVAEESLEIKAK